ncbi:MAG: electron transfer flavoprotein subunit beta/FixA family protein [SAR324 cluster bacterium]|nr:electron transfer flavoprotein subunit beta/FixA family protein [SAR324 cluster bacterium]
MNILVLIKQVIDVELSIRVKDGSIVEDGLQYVIGGWDEIAVEAALQISESAGGEVTLLTIGPERAAEALRKGLAMGAHQAIHIKDDAFNGSDSFVYAQAIKKAISGKSYDLIIAGKQSQDTDSGLTGGMLAEFLGLPQVTNVAKIDKISSDKLELRRTGDNGQEVIELTLPAVITVSDSLYEPRLASMRGIMQARKKPLEELTAAAIGLSAGECGKAGAQTIVISFMEPESRKEGKKFEGDEADTVKQVVNLLVNEVKMFS